MNWTDSRLKKLWADGLSASRIAAQGGVTRNAVIGKVHRLKLSRATRARDRIAGAPEEDPGGGELGQEPKPLGHDFTHDDGVDRRNRAADAVRCRAHRQASAAAVENVVVPISRRLQLIQLNEHLQVAERQSAVGGLPFLRQRRRRS